MVSVLLFEGKNELTPREASTQAAAATLTALPATPAAPGQVPPIIVNPSPVVVVAPPPAKTKSKKHTSRIHQKFNKLGNRMSEAPPRVDRIGRSGAGALRVCERIG
jgi:hypothetical protein